MFGLTPANRQAVDRFLRAYRALPPGAEVDLEVFAERLGWPVEPTRDLAKWLLDRGLIDADEELGTGVIVISAPD